VDASISSVRCPVAGTNDHSRRFASTKTSTPSAETPAVGGTPLAASTARRATTVRVCRSKSVAWREVRAAA
jgi:hypothetical protein